MEHFFKYLTRGGHPDCNQFGYIPCPKCCPKCGSVQTIRYGKTNTGLIGFRCKDCGGTFNIITGTIFDQRKISVSQWLDFMVMVIEHGSFNLTSKKNRNAYTTTKY